MAASDSEEEEEEERSSSGDEDEDDSSSDGNSDGSSSSGEEDSEGDDASEAVDEDEDELKQARVRSDIQEMRLMVGEMEKIKQRLLFRLEREKQAKLEEANWQQQQQQQERLAEEEEARRQQQQQKEEAERKVREESKIVQESAAQQQQQQSSPERSLVEIGVQTELGAASVANHELRMSLETAGQALKSPLASAHVRTESALKQASISTEDQSARLSLYDLGKSYGMHEAPASPTMKREPHQQQQQQTYESAPAPVASASRNAPAPPSDASDSDTFFIRRDSNRTSWQPDVPNHHNGSFQRSQGSVLDSEYDSEDEHVRSPAASQAGTQTSKSALQTLRNSILSSIHEGTSSNAVGSNRSAALVESRKLFESQRSRFGDLNLSDNDDAAKTDEQREQEAIQSLLFGR